MENKEISKEMSALLFISQTLDQGLAKGAYVRTQVLSYNEALGELEKFIAEAEKTEE